MGAVWLVMFEVGAAGSAVLGTGGFCAPANDAASTTINGTTRHLSPTRENLRNFASGRVEIMAESFATAAKEPARRAKAACR